MVIQSPVPYTQSEVSDDCWHMYMDQMVPMVRHNVDNFKSGQIKYCSEFWRTITSDSNILKMVKGCPIELEEYLDYIKPAKEICMNQAEQAAVTNELSQLADKGVIVAGPHDPSGVVSNIFVRPKPDGYRVILNLKPLNEFVVYRHFKMETLQSVLELMTENCYMATIDLKDAYFSVPVASAFQKYLQFNWQSKPYKFTSLAQGLSSAPRQFTKLTKPIFATLRKQGHINSPYIDDAFLMGDSLSDCRRNVMDTVEITTRAGFVINPDKSNFEPSHEVTFVGFVLNSVRMTVRLTEKKALSLRDTAHGIVHDNSVTILQVAQLVGKMVASFPAVMYGELFYRQIDMEKTQALADSKGNFEAKMTLSKSAREDLNWWIDNIMHASRPVSLPMPSVTLQSDSSSKAWGGVCGKDTTGGNWSHSEKDKHINYLEIKAAWFTLQSFCNDLRDTHIQIQVDNTTAVAYINKMGGKSSDCNAIARKLWLWAYDRNLVISATFLPGALNVVADYESRRDHDNTEWMLDRDVFSDLVHRWSEPEVDLFASRLNNQLKTYISWRPDPGATAVDAFSVPWSKYRLVYIFPPFCLLLKALNKLARDKCTAIIVVPYWPTQTWFSRLFRMLIACPVLLRRCPGVLKHPCRSHETLPKMTLMACLVSGNNSKTEAFLRQRRQSSCTHGGEGHRRNIGDIVKSGFVTVVKGTSVHCHHL